MILTTTIISFAIGLAFALLYMIVRGHIPYKGIAKGVVFGLMVWAMTECVKAAQIIAYTTIPVMFSIIWLLQGLISYLIYGIVLSTSLEPHADDWLHPELILHLSGSHPKTTRKTRKAVRGGTKRKSTKKKSTKKRTKTKKRTVKRRSSKKRTKRKTSRRR